MLTSLTCFSLRSLKARCAARFCSLRFIRRPSSLGLDDKLWVSQDWKVRVITLTALPADLRLAEELPLLFLSECKAEDN